jgi:hypothetical protein
MAVFMKEGKIISTVYSCSIVQFQIVSDTKYRKWYTSVLCPMSSHGHLPHHPFFGHLKCFYFLLFSFIFMVETYEIVGAC